MPDHKLVSLKVPSLQYRRWREDVILMYKIILGITGNDIPKFTFRDTFPTTRGHWYKVFKYPVHYSARAILFPAKLVTCICGITYLLILSKLHH